LHVDDLSIGELQTGYIHGVADCVFAELRPGNAIAAAAFIAADAAERRERLA